LAFGIVSIGYLVVLEIFLIAFVVFVLGPLLLVSPLQKRSFLCSFPLFTQQLTLNLLMICLGRPLDGRGNLQIRAEIPKIDQKYVDSIPLVVFIPEEEPNEGEEKKEDNDNEHTYPPKPVDEKAAGSSKPIPTPTPAPEQQATEKPRKGRFRFLRRKTKQPETQSEPKAEEKPSATAGAQEEDAWEAQFEKGEYPFVRLDGNRATCAICLCDFVPPKPRGGVAPPAASGSTPGPSDVEASSVPNADESTVSNNEEQKDDDKDKQEKSKSKSKKIKKEKEEQKVEEDEEVGVPGEPLRLLECGHVFHKQCLDPWLLDVSGRCPVCQRRVLPEGVGDEEDSN
jgi:hypothetical protein